MKKETYYTYLGNNGTITTSVYLEGIYSIKKYMIIADKDKKLTKDGKTFQKTILIPATDQKLWYKIEA